MDDSWSLKAMLGFRTSKQDRLKLLHMFQVCNMGLSPQNYFLNLLGLILLEVEEPGRSPAGQDVPRFIMKLWNLVEQPDYQELICWSQVSGSVQDV